MFSIISSDMCLELVLVVCSDSVISVRMLFLLLLLVCMMNSIYLSDIMIIIV